MFDQHQMKPTVDFAVFDTEGERVGSMESWTFPARGDYLRVYGVEESGEATWEVVRLEFLPDAVNVVVKPLDGQGATTSAP